MLPLLRRLQAGGRTLRCLNLASYNYLGFAAQDPYCTPRVEEVLAAWRRISAPVLWVDGDLTDLSVWWGQRYSLAEFDQRIAVVPQLRRERLSPCGHMLHHEQPAALAALLVDFLG
ncbi:MAG: hypothetical protein J0M20_07180 [Burkholderiales bacterium]|nr:hypothetical protein [Burkholderiales bacterium]